MLFNSHIFLFVFLPVVWLLFHTLRRRNALKGSIGLLVISSLVFYAWWNPPFVGLIIGSILFNHRLGARLYERVKAGYSGRPLMWAGVVFNLGLIAVFKYADFFGRSFAFFSGTQWSALSLFLPLGISFFTFQQIAWLVDLSAGRSRHHSLLHYAFFVTFFPQLIAGPIVREDQVLHQLDEDEFKVGHSKNYARGLMFLSLGLFKKVVIADQFSPWVSATFDTEAPIAFFDAWAGALAYTFQIYFDFSGYSDMAIGLGLLFNIRLPINFNAPYQARSIVDFWRRWHMTLSAFLRDYLYIGLGGNRRGKVRRYINLMLTMLLGGLWHGAAWTFVVWGGLHGLYLCINHGWTRMSTRLNFQLPSIVAWALTMGAVMVGWVFFRANSFERATEFLIAMSGLDGFGISHMVPGAKVLLWAIPALLVTALCPPSQSLVERVSQRPKAWVAVVVGLTLAISLGHLERVSEFLYFQF